MGLQAGGGGDHRVDSRFGGAAPPLHMRGPYVRWDRAHVCDHSCERGARLGHVFVAICAKCGIKTWPVCMLLAVSQQTHSVHGASHLLEEPGV